MRMYVYASTYRNLMRVKCPIAVETNFEFAVPYWTNRKKSNPKIFWEFGNHPT